MKNFYNTLKLGVLGGGQLGKMLLNETRKWNIYTAVLDPSNDAPARTACSKFVKGDLLDYDTVYAFGKETDILTIEIENVNIDAIKTLAEKGVKTYPTYETIKIIQNKQVQKGFLKKHNIPTSDFQCFDSKKDLMSNLNNISFPTVWKAAMFGYDGKGVKIINTIKDFDELNDTACLLEDKVIIKKEISIIIARNVNGVYKAYTPVEMQFDNEANLVNFVISPADISERVIKKSNEIAKRVSETLEHIGLIAIEMFVTKDDQVLVNEIAPRPHNSGHLTIENCYTNQFEQHLRAILNLPLGSTKNKSSSVMVNLVGDDKCVGVPIFKNIEKFLKIEGLTPHIYGKKETKPFRKMGHVTLVGDSVSVLMEKAREVKTNLTVEVK